MHRLACHRNLPPSPLSRPDLLCTIFLHCHMSLCMPDRGILPPSLVPCQVGVAGWLEAFAAHPRIGDVEGLKKKFGGFADMSKKEQAGAAQASAGVLEVPTSEAKQIRRGQHSKCSILCNHSFGVNQQRFSDY